jgi:hypothetical protein
VLVVVEVFIVSSESEPGSGKPIPSSRFVVSERSSWVMGDEGGESTSGLKEGAESDGLCDVRRELWSCGDVGGRDGEGSSDLEDERDSVSARDLRIGPSEEEKEIGPMGGSVYG